MKAPLTALEVAKNYHETVHQIIHCSNNNFQRVEMFRRLYEDLLTADQLTHREIISAMCEIELTIYS